MSEIDDDHGFNVGDLEFGLAVRRASEAIAKSAKDLRAAFKRGETADLISYLKSSKPIFAADRELLADLLCGEIARQPGRPKRPFSERSIRQEAHYLYKLAMQARPRPRSILVAEQVGKKLGLKTENVLSIVKDRKMRM